MLVLLRNVVTGLYLQRDNEWTPDPEMARPFLDASLAYQYRAVHALPDTYVVPSPHSDLLAPVDRRLGSNLEMK